MRLLIATEHAGLHLTNKARLRRQECAHPAGLKQALPLALGRGQALLQRAALLLQGGRLPLQLCLVCTERGLPLLCTLACLGCLFLRFGLSVPSQIISKLCHHKHGVSATSC